MWKTSVMRCCFTCLSSGDVDESDGNTFTFTHRERFSAGTRWRDTHLEEPGLEDMVDQDVESVQLEP